MRMFFLSVCDFLYFSTFVWETKKTRHLALKNKICTKTCNKIADTMQKTRVRYLNLQRFNWGAKLCCKKKSPCIFHVSCLCVHLSTFLLSSVLSHQKCIKELLKSKGSRPTQNYLVSVSDWSLKWLTIAQNCTLMVFFKHRDPFIQIYKVLQHQVERRHFKGRHWYRVKRPLA